MRITRLQLKNFKRFTDLTIESIPKEAKLVLLIGSNGSGKSSIFDAFNSLAKNWNYPRRQIILKMIPNLKFIFNLKTAAR